jgi:putative IMPACT (imprinted ancient) family translation regulator
MIIHPKAHHQTPYKLLFQRKTIIQKQQSMLYEENFSNKTHKTNVKVQVKLQEIT